MIELELQLVRENPDWLTVLRAYRAAYEELSMQAAEANATPSLDAIPDLQEADVEEATEGSVAERPRKAIWIPRLAQLPGIESEDLSRIHGGLIAYGLLKCDLADRSTGVVYQLTSVARQVIERESDERSTALDDAA